MPERGRLAVCFVGALAGAAVGRAPVVSTQGPSPVTLDALVARAGVYVSRFTRMFQNVVAEERYVQRTTGRQSVSVGGRGVSVRPDTERRELVSDFLLVKIPGLDTWVPFRDVFEVDGRPVREREARLATLILQPAYAGFEQAEAIAKESARYNIGTVERTINMPLLVLSFFDVQQQHRFSFTLDREERAGSGVWIVAYDEQARPTVVQTPEGREWFASGQAWIDASTGTIRKTELRLLDSTLRTRITTSFHRDDRFDLDVPSEMDEEYALLKSRAVITGRASYSRFRRFDVTASEVIDTPVPK